MITEYEIPAELLARCAGQAQICKTVLGKYTEQMNSDLPQLACALNQSDLEQVSRLAHRIKGASANVAAEEVRSFAAELEVVATQDQVDKAKLLLEELRCAWRRFEELTANFLSS